MDRQEHFLTIYLLGCNLGDVDSVSPGLFRNAQVKIGKLVVEGNRLTGTVYDEYGAHPVEGENEWDPQLILHETFGGSRRTYIFKNREGHGFTGRSFVEGPISNEQTAHCVLQEMCNSYRVLLDLLARMPSAEERGRIFTVRPGLSGK